MAKNYTYNEERKDVMTILTLFYTGEVMDNQYGCIGGTRYTYQEILQESTLREQLKRGNCTDPTGAPLQLCDGPVRGQYIRHLNTHTHEGVASEMTPWHVNWQNKFGKREYHFGKTHRADVKLDNGYIIEFQNSPISTDEVEKRRIDYEKSEHHIIWVINAEDSLTVTPFKDGRCFVEFGKDTWKYTHFIQYEWVFYDFEGKIYPVCPQQVKSFIIDVHPPMTHKEFVNKVQENPPTVFPTTKLDQTKMFIKQQGAGNGKTFGAVQLLVDPKFRNYDTFLYLTKQHSAKHVIYAELKDQIEKKLLNIQLQGEPIENNKKYVINFKNSGSSNTRKVIIATFDAFVWVLGDLTQRQLDKFQGLVQSIIDDEYALPVPASGAFKFAGSSIKLSKRLLLVGDEIQDLPKSYIQALIRIMRERYISLYLVQDKLQSLASDDNAAIYLESIKEDGVPNTETTKYPSENKCRRFFNPSLVEFVNKFIKFDEWGLPPVTPYKKGRRQEAVTFIQRQQEPIWSQVRQLMKYYQEEVEQHGRQPKDFLVVTPFTSTNPVVDALELAIREYWINREGGDQYRQYAIFHKSDDGRSIDLSKSEKETRLVSIHTSKGDGRPVVFLIGLSTNALRYFGVKPGDLQYESFLHVAVTRMKEKLYIYHEDVKDDVCSRLFNTSVGNGQLYWEVSKFIDTDKLLTEPLFSTMNKVEGFAQIQMPKQEETFETSHHQKDVKDKRLVDLQHHLFRYGSMVSTIYFEIVADANRESSHLKKHINMLFKTIYDAEIKCCTTMKEYYETLNWESGLREIPLIKFSRNRKYSHYYDDIKTLIEDVQKLLKRQEKSSEMVSIENPLHSIMIYYLMEMARGQTPFSITDLYDIIASYKETDEALQDHYDRISNTQRLFRYFKTNYPAPWDYVQPQQTFLEGNQGSTAFCVKTRIELQAYTEDKVVIFVIRPQLSDINFNETKLKTVLDTFVLKNAKQINRKGEKTKQANRTHGREIFTCVISLDLDEPLYFMWDNIITSHDHDMRSTLVDEITKHYESYSLSMYHFFKYWVENTEGKPDKKVKAVVREFDTRVQDKHPSTWPKYVGRFFDHIKDDIIKTIDKQAKKNMLEQLLGEEFFVERLRVMILREVQDYIGFEEESDSSDSD